MYRRLLMWGSRLAVSSKTRMAHSAEHWLQSLRVAAVPRGPQPSPSRVGKAAAPCLCQWPTRFRAGGQMVARAGAPRELVLPALRDLLSEEKLNHFVFLV